MKGIYFEEKGLALLAQCGITKSEFARRMGIQRQNVNVLFKTNNLEIIARAAEVLDVPLALLVGYVDEPDIFSLPINESCKSEQSDERLEITPGDVPVGDTVEDMRGRQELIKQFYFYWKKQNPELCRFSNV